MGERFEVDPRKGREDAEIAQMAKVVTFSEAVTPPPEHQLVECGSEHPPDNEGLGMFKSANRELRTKVRVLHDKLHSVCRERDCLQETLENMSTQLSSLQQEKSKLKHKNKKWAEEKRGLKAKNKDLMRENAVLTQHCQRQVAQMGAYEAQLRTLSGENQQQLRRKTRASPQSAHQKEPKITSGPVPTNTQIGSVGQKPVIDVFVRDSDKTGDKRSQRAAKKTNGTGINWFHHYQGSSPPGILPHNDIICYTGTVSVTSSCKPHKEGIKGGQGVQRGGVSLSEDHIMSIMDQLRGGRPSFQCPICMKVLHSHETEFSAQLHVEHCLQ